MSDKKRNFWILLTMIAVILAAGKVIRSNQSHHSFHNIHTPHSTASPHHRHEHPCKKKKKRKKRRTCSSQYRLSSPAIDDFVLVQQEPRALNLKEVRYNISYPYQKHKSLKDESIVARILVDHNGSYLRHRIISQSNSQLRSRCDKFLPNLKFTPAIRDGKAIKYWVNVPLYFNN